MEPTDLLALVGAQLDRIGCPRFTTGSVASMVYGEPRFTNDIDIVVRLDERKARDVAAAFVGDDWYPSAEAATDWSNHTVGSGLAQANMPRSARSYRSARISGATQPRAAGPQGSSSGSQSSCCSSSVRYGMRHQ